MKNAAILLDKTLDFLNGNVEKVMKKTYEVKGDSKKLKDHSVKEYNLNGVRMRTIYYKDDGSIKQEQVSKFDSNGFKVGYTNVDKNKDVVSDGKYLIDSDGKILKKYFNGELEEIYSYDQRGRLIEQIYMHSRDKSVYIYNNEGNFIDEQTNFIGGVKKFLVKFFNDSYGNILRAETYRLPSMENAHTQFSIINDRGDEIEAYVILGTGAKVNWKKYEYKYDSSGNWIIRINEHVASNSKDIDERIIEYYF